jgi:uncharacterized protein
MEVGDLFVGVLVFWEYYLHMLVEDRIYGSFDIESPILLELLNSRLVVRLKNISQLGLPDKYFHVKGFSRYEHSVGVMILLKMLGSSEKEQIAGLLHDVSHTVFSHVIDWVVSDGGEEGYQDSQHEKVMSGELGVILEKYGYDYREIANLEKYRLLDCPIPSLCVDRIDYSLRQFPRSIVKECLRSMVVNEGRIMFNDVETAKLFAEYFLDKQMNFWGGADGVTRYVIFAKTLKIALAKGLISIADFWLDENIVLKKLERGGDEIQNWLKLLIRKSLNDLPAGERIVRKKFRFVDPEVVVGGKLLGCLSEINSVFKNKLESAKRDNEKGIKLPEIVSKDV